MVHSSGTVGQHYYTYLGPLSQKYSIAGFFLLSSFLLTYRLILDLDRPKTNPLIAILKYSIRRVFRIYFIFVAFCVAGLYFRHVFGGFLSGSYTNLYAVLTLGYAGFNILWTIPSELRYYFVIPVVCLLFTRLKRFQWHLLAISMVWTVYDQFFNFFGTSWEVGVKYDSKESNLLKNHFFVFFSGSQLAMALFLLERSENFIAFIRKTRVQILIIICSVLLTAFVFYYQTGIFGNKYDYR